MFSDLMSILLARMRFSTSRKSFKNRCGRVFFIECSFRAIRCGCERISFLVRTLPAVRKGCPENSERPYLIAPHPSPVLLRHYYASHRHLEFCQMVVTNGLQRVSLLMNIVSLWILA
jgi:hypothetical protein